MHKIILGLLAVVLCALAFDASARFLSADPVPADPNTGTNFNRYYYANNNPYRFTDPDGRQAADRFSDAFAKNPQAFSGPEHTIPAMAVTAVMAVPLAVEIGFSALANPATATALGEAAVLTGVSVTTGIEVPGSIPGSGAVSRAVSVEARAASLATEAGSNSVSVRTGSGLVRYDLQGASHYSKATGAEVPTPHVQEYANNVIPSGPRAGQVGSVTSTGDVRPATHPDLRAAERIVRDRQENP